MSFAIWGMGTALPSAGISQEEAAEVINRASGYDPVQSRWVQSVYRGAGVHHRQMLMLEHLDEILGSPGGVPRFTTGWRMERYEQAIAPLAAEAATQALDAAGVEPSEITHLVTVSCTGFSAPGFDLALFERLGLRPVVQRTHVGFMGCHGALNGLRVAGAFAGSDPAARVLVCAAELTSLHFRYEFEPKLSLVNALFADGAAAVVGRASPKEEPDPWRLVASGSALVPGTTDAMSWRIGDQGFTMTLSPLVGRHIGDHLKPWLESWLDSQGMALGDVASWAIHPGGPKILDAAESALGLGPSATEDSRAILAAFGNMSSPTVLFLIDRLKKKKAPLPCVALAFGPGLAIEAALFR